jgi:hypothetical protein
MSEKKSSMRWIALGCLGVFLLAGQPLLAAELSQADRDAAVKSLNETRQEFLDSIAGLSEAQWTFKSAPDRWSIAEVAEHLAVTETALPSMVSEQILKTPAGATPASEKVPDARIFEVITDRSGKAQAPEMIRPTGRWSTPEEILKAFNEGRDKNLEYIRTTSDDLRAHAVPHPAVKAPVDAYQWFLLLSAHCTRHTAQIEEVKADPGFPKS